VGHFVRSRLPGLYRTTRWKPLRSLRNRLAFLFFAITLLAIGVLYMYVAPGLQTRLTSDKLGELASAARRDSGPVGATVGSSDTLFAAKAGVDAAGGLSGARVTLLSVRRTPRGPRLASEADSSTMAAAQPLRRAIARRAVATRMLSTGTESGGPAGAVAQAAYPLSHHGAIAAVIVYSAPVSDIVRNVAIVRHEILVAGALALALALIGGYLVARALSLRVKRLERAAEQVAAGDFEHPIPVDSTDELGQLSIAFNDMQRQLAQLDSARKQFIATASHELRTPIFSLGGFVELLEDEELDAETRRRFLDQVKDQVRRLSKLSVDLLDLSRLESGSLELRPEQVDLGELTRSVSGEFEPTLAQHGSQLELKLPARPIEALCDPVRVAQIVRILVDNALTHTARGTRIVLSADRENGHVQLAVRDDGEGIERDAMLRVFEPFYTADDAQGSGLGLAIASELAGRMSGALAVQSGPGNTVFTLEIPA